MAEIMSKLYGYVPLLTGLGSLYFLLVMSLVPSSTSSLGLDFNWHNPDVVAVSLILVVVVVTACAKSRTAKRIGLLVNGIIVLGMTGDLLHVQHSPLLTDYLWLWGILMLFDFGLLCWGSYQLWRNQK
ncbi:hypothetical protein FD07_GL000529 [Levilactobacillus parabrevis ATCC 53295]|uniref:Uncharacterized protein n=2 Tax=Levilactobacillus parabrevis TaxID=357278 RepID=A0A0R1GS03_9LACO|nr:hypothetical protein FD07_GL000529 [Levilactobacillus parabrevis ATCC 53295]KRO05966.1 hypothetical protein IV61_GL000588 [Levilactobacillus parabrevis]